MATGTRSSSDVDAEPAAVRTPEVSVCETCPGKFVFVESGNDDGWLSTDTVLDVTR
jgi:hypothetical protein